jgi:uncharacterized protein YjdB
MRRNWSISSAVRTLGGATLRSAVSVLLLQACLDDTPVTAGPPTVRAMLNANVVGEMAGGTVRIRVGYRSSRQVLVPLPSSPEQITLSAGTTVVLPLTVDIGPCLADRTRFLADEPGCTLTIELTLADAAGQVVDTQTRDAEAPATPGQSVNFGSLTIGVIVSTIALTPATLSLNVGQEQQVTAVVRDLAGAVVTALPVVWTITDGTVAQSGASTAASVTVRALKLGTTTLTATAGGKTSAPVTVNVVPPTPLTIRQRPSSGCIIVGQTVTLDVVSPPGAVTWSISNAAVATIGATTGVATGVAAGQTTVTATSGNRTGTAAVCVVGPLAVTPQSLSIVAARTSQLSVANAGGATLSFASNAPGVATVDAAGLVRGVSIGQATITTTLTGGSGSVTATTPVTVTAGSVAVSPTSATAPVNSIARFTAVVRDADGVALPGAVPTWTISDPTIGTLSTTSGITVDVRALKIGSATVRAAAGGATASATFTVTTPLPAARLEKVSGDGTACPTQSTNCTFVVRAVDANGVPVPGTQITWSALPTCAPPTFATTDANGLATSSNICSTAAGTYTQIATLQTNQQQVSFSFSLRGVVLAFQSVDSSGVSTYAVTSATNVASGLSVDVKYRSGPAEGYVTVLKLNRTATPAVLSVAFDASNLPSGDYEFDLIVSTTTPGIGPGVETVRFSNSFESFTAPNAQRRPSPARISAAPSAP